MTKFNGFTPVSDKLSIEYDPLTALVYGKIWRYSSKSGVCTASIDRMSSELGISKRTFHRKAKLLITDEYLQIKKRPGFTDEYSTTKKLEYETTISEVVTESHGGMTESQHPVTESHGGSDTESHEDSIEDSIEDTNKDVNNFSILSAAFWTISGIPEPKPGGRGWDDWSDGIEDLIKIGATIDEMKQAKIILDEGGYSCTRPGAIIKTIVNSRKNSKRQPNSQNKVSNRPLPKGV